jgi:hypothetical protein
LPSPTALPKRRRSRFSSTRWATAAGSNSPIVVEVRVGREEGREREGTGEREGEHKGKEGRQRKGPLKA